MNLKTIDDRFDATGQIRPEDVGTLAELGYGAIVCARPDGEDAGQPAFADIAREAERHGLRALHYPMSGVPSPEQVASFSQALTHIEGRILGYCRSGARAGTLYTAAR